MSRWVRLLVALVAVVLGGLTIGPSVLAQATPITATHSSSYVYDGNGNPRALTQTATDRGPPIAEARGIMGDGPRGGSRSSPSRLPEARASKCVTASTSKRRLHRLTPPRARLSSRLQRQSAFRHSTVTGLPQKARGMTARRWCGTIRRLQQLNPFRSPALLSPGSIAAGFGGSTNLTGHAGLSR